MFDANDPNPAEPFYLIVTDLDRGVFCVEGPMTDDRSWEAAALFARNNQLRITCGPTGADRDALAAEFRRATITSPVFRRRGATSSSPPPTSATRGGIEPMRSATQAGEAPFDPRRSSGDAPCATLPRRTGEHGTQLSENRTNRCLSVLARG